jgi:predicted ester cyclase
MTNEAIARDILTRINAGDVAGAAAHFAEDCKNHEAVPEAQGRAGFVRILTRLREAFPDLNHELASVVASGDQVAIVSTVTGTHRHRLDFVRLQVEPTGKSVKFTQILVMRFANSKVVENHTCRDQMATFRQLGLKIVQA